MISAADITASLQTTLQADATLTSLNFVPSRILRGDVVNKNPNNTPWLGIFRTKVAYAPGSLGRGNPDAWDGTITIRLLIQASHLHDAAACEDRLESYIKAALDSIWSDPTWSNVVDMVTGIDVEYSYREDDESTIYFQWALVTITAEASTG